LYLIKLSLPGPEYWDQPVLFSIRFQDAEARGFMHFHTSEFSYYDCFSVGSLATVYQLFLCFVRRITVETQSSQVTAVLDEKIFRPPNGSKPSLRIVILQHKAGCYTVGPDYQHNKEKQVEASELILNSLITGRNLTKDDLAFLYGLKGDAIAHDVRVFLRYIITELAQSSGLPTHPWSRWLVEDVPVQTQVKSPHAKVDERSRDALKEVIYKISEHS